MSRLRPTRRQVLTIGSLTSVGVGIGGFLWLPGPAEGRHVLSEGELSVIGALGEVMFPEGNAIGLSGLDIGLEGEVDLLLGETLDPKLVPPFRYLLRFVQFGTIAQTGKRFTSCSPEKRAELLAEWGRPGSKFRNGGIASLKSVLGMAYFNHPDVLNAIGWRSYCAAKPGSA